MEIGSEFWIEKYHEYEEHCRTPNWLERFGNTVLTSSGRGAINLVLDQLTPKIKRALLPSYICDSVIIPFEQAGYDLIYYDVDKHFRPINIDFGNIEIGVFYHLGYFGFPTNEILNEVIPKLRALSVCIIEDVTHTLFSSYQRLMDNDVYIGSIRKWFGIPSGGFLASKQIIHKQLTDPPSEFIDLRFTGLQKKLQYMRTMDMSLKDEYITRFRKAEQMLNEDTSTYRIDKLSKKIIQNISIKYIVNARRENYKTLLKHLKCIKGLEIIFGNIDDTISPIFFPIYVKHGKRDKLKADLVREKIYCPIHWPIPEQLEDKLSSKTRSMYDSLLSLPCDQRYSIDDMHRIINTIKELI